MGLNEKFFASADEDTGPHFNTLLYTGNAASTRSITGAGFEPDLVWIKERDGTPNHHIFDVLRGGNKMIASNNTSAEGNALQFTLDNDGFSINNSAYGDLNGLNDKYVAWCFKAGGAAVLNEEGTIDSQVSANNDLGFSIVSYIGNGSPSERTIGHGLDEVPEMVIIKDLDNVRNWYVYTDIIDGSMDVLYLNKTDAKANSAITNPTSSVYKISGATTLNKANQHFISYCFASVAGVSKVGSYTGTGAVGNYVNTGFEPAFVMVKRTNGTGDWMMHDNKRSANNGDGQDLVLYANLSNSEDEYSSGGVVFNSNGFTLNVVPTSTNLNGGKYIYYAVAD